MALALSVVPADPGASARGAMALGFGFIFFGALLCAWIGMWAVLRFRKARSRPRTRTAGFLGAIAGSALALAAVFAYGLSLAPRGTLSQLPERVKAVRDTMPVELPPVLERMAGGKERIKAQQEMTKGMANSPAFIWWSIVVGTVMTCTVLGTFIGSIAFALAMVAGRIVGGRWPLGAPDPALAPVDGSAAGHDPPES